MSNQSGRVHIDALAGEKLPKALVDAIDSIEIEEETDLPPPSPFVDLRNELAAVYSDTMSARRIAEDAGISNARVDFQTSPINVWHSLLKEVVHARLYKQLRAVVLAEYPRNRKLREAFDRFTCQPP